MPNAREELGEEISKLLQSKVENKEIPGVVIHAASRDGRPIVSCAAGKSSILDTSNTMTVDTMFWTGSCTKVLTSLCAMKCVDTGLISLDEDVLPYLPDLARQKVRNGYNPGTNSYSLAPRHGTVTLRHLLSMTSGLGYPLVEKITQMLSHNANGQGPPYEYTAETNHMGDFECQPGAKWAYSCGMDWAGILVERLSGLKLGDFANKYLLEPCGVSASELIFVLTPVQYSNLARAHWRFPDGTLVARPDIFKGNIQQHLGGIGMFSTARALADILLILVNNGKHPTTGNQVLSPGIIKEMLTAQLSAAQRTFLVDMALHPMRSSPNTVQWGLGFVLLPEGAGL